ncbi:MAG TPA: hypothetical protein PKI59_06195, partial [Candidatus Cloacimonadota bacterium]|nr:hypothetical protein [Candidatus Cloacimonadota bacterium]
MLNDLSGGPIPASELSLVFDGFVEYPSGQNTINIDFPEPFMYLGNQNLVVMFYRPWDTVSYTSSETFRCQIGDGVRGWIIAASSEYPLPESPVGGLPTSIYPKLRLSTEPRPSLPQFELSSEDGDFGSIPLGHTVSKTYTVKNVGYGSFSLSSVALSGSQCFTLSTD